MNSIGGTAEVDQCHDFRSELTNLMTQAVQYWQCPALPGFGGLVVSVLASGTQDRGFKPGRIRRIFRAKKSLARIPSEGKQSRLSHVADLRHVKDPWKLRGIRGFQAKFVGHFSLISVPRYRRALMLLDVERLWGWRSELKAVHKVPASLRPRCDGVIAP